METQVFLWDELDHLDGILFTERAIDQGLPLYQEDGDQLTPLKLPTT